MKITDITVTEFSLGRLARPYWNSIIRTESKGFSRLEVHTDEGISGMSFGGGGSAVTGRLKQLLLGQDPLNAEACWDRMYAHNRKPVAKGEYINAMGALDIALWDLRGKALNQPCWKLLGGHRQRIPVYGAGGYYEGTGTSDEKGIAGLVAELTGFLEHGYRAVKMKVGWPGAGLKHDAERVRAVREAVGPEVDVLVDVNNAWDAVTAIRFGRMIERYEPYWLEEPTPAADYRGQRQICEALRPMGIPVASGENEFTRWGFRDLIEAKAVDIVQADPRTTRAAASPNGSRSRRWRARTTCRWRRTADRTWGRTAWGQSPTG